MKLKGRELICVLFFGTIFTLLAGLPVTDLHRNLEMSTNFPGIGNADLQEITVYPGSEKIVFLYNKGLIISTMSSLQAEYVYSSPNFNEDTKARPTKFSSHSIYLASKGKSSPARSEISLRFEVGSRTEFSQSTYYTNFQFGTSDSKFYAESNNMMHWIRDATANPPLVADLAIGSDSSSNSLYLENYISDECAPCIVRGFNNKLKGWACQSFSSTYLVPVMEIDLGSGFIIRRVVENVGTNTVIVEATDHCGFLVFCLVDVFQQSLVGSCTQEYDYKTDSTFYTGVYIYFMEKESASSRTYSCIRRSDLQADPNCKPYTIDNLNPIKFDQYAIPLDPHTMPLLASDRVIIFDDRQAEQKEIKIAKPKNMVPLMDITSSIYLVHDDNNIYSKHHLNSDLIYLETFPNDIIRNLITLPKSKFYVVFFDDKFVIRGLGSEEYDTKDFINHDIDALCFSSSILKYAFFTKTSRFAYYSTSGINIVNYFMPNNIRKRVIAIPPSHELTAMSVLNNDEYLAYGSKFNNEYYLTVIEIETETVLFQIKITQRINSIKPSWLNPLKNKKYFFYSTDDKVVMQEWMDQVFEKLEVTKPSDTSSIVDFDILPNTYKLVVIYQSNSGFSKTITYDFSLFNTNGVTKDYETLLKSYTGTLYNLRSDLVWIGQGLTFEVYSFKSMCPTGFLLHDSKENCYRNCPSGKTFLDWERDLCDVSCSQGTAVKSSSAYFKPLDKLCFENSCSIQNCDICYGNRCYKCSQNYYIDSVNSFADSCSKCDGSDDVKSTHSIDAYWGSGYCNYGRTILNCAAPNSGACTKCLSPFLKENVQGQSTFYCGSCINNGYNLYPAQPSKDGSDICSNTRDTSVLCDRANFKSCFKTAFGNDILDTNNDGFFEGVGTCSEFSSLYKPTNAEGQGFCYKITNIINGCKSLTESTGCDECLSNYKASFRQDTYYDSCLDCNDPGQSKDETSIKKCNLCDKLHGIGCATCSQTECLTCATDFYMFNDVSQKRKYCSKCDMGNKYVIVETECKLCSEVANLENCLECTTEDICIYCTKCYDHYDLYSPNFDTKFTTCKKIEYLNYLSYKRAVDGSGIVYDCMTGCAVCDSPGTCKRCNTGLYLYNYDGDAGNTYEGCIRCNEQNQFIALNVDPPVCKKCRVVNCDVCAQGEENKCQKCLNGWYLYSTTQTTDYDKCVKNIKNGGYYCEQPVSEGYSKCIDCLSNCESCVGATNCENCKAGFYLFDGNYDGRYELCLADDACNLPFFIKTYNDKGFDTCIRCKDSFENCAECKSSTSCSKCQTYFWLYSLPGDNNNMRCTTCQGVRQIRVPEKEILGKGNCKTCPEGCETCDTEGNCLKCVPGVHLYSTTATEIMDQCIVCNQADQYIEFSPSKQALVCRKCSTAISNCKNCHGNKNTCDECQDASYWRFSSLDNNQYDKCVKAFPTSGDDIYWRWKSDVTGATGRVFLCRENIQNCEMCNQIGETCSKCLPGYYLFKSRDSTNIDLCVPCDQEGQVISGAFCKLCEDLFPNCASCEFSEIIRGGRDPYLICKLCKSRFALRQFDIIYEKCDVCIGGLEVEKKNLDGVLYCEKCPVVIASCYSCLDSSNCEQCSDGFSLYKSLDGRTICVDCKQPNYYLKTAQTPQCEASCCDCSVAIENCVECNGLTNVCSKCADGYFLFSSQNNGVYDSCALCKQPNQVQNIKALASTNQIVCDVCSKAMANCKFCYGVPNMCQACEVGFYRTSSKRDGVFDKCTPCTDEGFYTLGLSNGLGYCMYCDDLIPGCRKCDGRTCSVCNDPFYLSIPSKDACVVCTGQEEMRKYDLESGMGNCYPRPVASEIIGFVSKDQSLASVSLSCNQGGSVYFAIGKDNKFVSTLNFTNIKSLSSTYNQNSALNISSLTDTLYLKSSLLKTPYKLDISILGLNLREDYTIIQYCVNNQEIESQTSLFVYSTANVNDEEVRQRAVPISQGLVWGLVVGLLITLLLIFCVLLGTQYTRSRKELKLLSTQNNQIE